MQWTAKYFDNVYLLTDEQPNLTTDLVVYVSPEDKTVVIDHESINHEVLGQPTKILWCYEPGRKLAGRATFVWLPITIRAEARTIAQDLVPVQPMSPPDVVMGIDPAVPTATPTITMSLERAAQYSMLNRYSETEVDERFYVPVNMLTN
jgi:hypothetical protein